MNQKNHIIGFKTIEYAGNGKEWQEFEKEKFNPNPANCIDMKGFQQPFFSKRDDVNWLPTLKRKEIEEPTQEEIGEQIGHRKKLKTKISYP
jgi:hypothetical protein